MRLTTFENPGAFVRIHPALTRRISVRMDSTFDCVVGQRTTPIRVVLDATVPQDQILVSENLCRELLPNIDLGWLNVTLSQNQMKVGPLIGVLCNPVWKPKQGVLASNKQLPGLQKMTEIGRRVGALVFVFGIRDVDFETKRIRGFVWGGGRWVPYVFPFPDVIYDQVISRKLERSKQYVQKRQRISEMYRGRIFNDGFFDKWEVHQWLTGDKRTRQHVPQTSMYTKPRSCVQFIRTHPVTFLKPVHGSLGLGIIRLIQQNNGSVVYEIKRRDAKGQFTAVSVDAAVEGLKRRLSTRPYLMQQGLSLARYQDRPFDVRIVLQRDGTGEWKRTKMFARVAGSGEFTSNLSSGGEAMSVPNVLKTLYKREPDRKRVQRTMHKVAGLVPIVMEEQSGKHIGELGVDIGLDDKGQVWIIEVNSKPWKRPDTEKGRQDIVDLAFERPIHYAIHLASKQP